MDNRFGNNIEENKKGNSKNEALDKIIEQQKIGLNIKNDTNKQEYNNNQDTKIPEIDQDIKNREFLDNPTQIDVDTWAKQYPYCKIFQFKILEDLYVIRSMQRYEYEEIAIRPNLNELSRERAIAELCTLFPTITPKLSTQLNAGIISALTEFVLEISGFPQYTQASDVRRLV